MQNDSSRIAKTPPNAGRKFIGGHFIKFRRDSTKFLTELAAKGDVTNFQIFEQSIYLINNPEMIRDVLTTNNAKFIKGRALQKAKILLGDGLLTSEGEDHLRKRRMIQPAFHKQRISHYADAMVESAERVCSQWGAEKIIDLDREMARLTLLIVGKTLFSIDVENDSDDVGKAMTDLVNSFSFLIIPYSELIERLPIPAARRSRNARNLLDSLIYRYIAERRESGKDYGDLLSMLLSAQDEENGSPMTDREVRDEALTLFIAGHETTANALTFAFYLISQNPEVQEKLYNEIDSALSGRAPSIDDTANLKYTEAVFAEALRLYPPAWVFSRIALEDHRFGEYTVKKGSAVMLSPYLTHRDKRFWERADEFAPERWFEKSIREAGQEFIYFPFSRGVRSCIGEGFAWTEGILTLATIARKYKVEFLPGQEFGLDPLVTLRPKYPIRMKVKSRKRK